MIEKENLPLLHLTNFCNNASTTRTFSITRYCMIKKEKKKEKKREHFSLLNSKLIRIRLYNVVQKYMTITMCIYTYTIYYVFSF